MNRYTIVFDGVTRTHIGTTLESFNEANDISGRRLAVKDGKVTVADYPYVRSAVIEAEDVGDVPKSADPQVDASPIFKG